MELLPLVCLCLLSCSGDAVRVVVKEGSDAVLNCSISTKEDLSGKLFDWRKDGQKEVFMYRAGIHYNNGLPGQDEDFEDRVSHFEDQVGNGNASIKITKTKMADSGNYSCDFPRLQPSQTFYIELVVGQVLRDRTGENIPGGAPEPIIKTLDHKPDRLLLQCEAHGDPRPTVEWKDSAGKTLPAEEPQISKQGRYSYVTVNITVTKTDKYRCVATQKNISHQIFAVIPVHIQGAASKPSVTILETDDGSLLQCEVFGASPKPKVEWKDSSGNILPVKDLKVTERGDSYDIVLQTTVTKTDRYRCVVTQEEINHHIYAEIYANISVSGSNTGAIVGGVVGTFLATLLVVGVLLAVLRAKGCIKLSCKNDEEKREPQTEPNSSTSLKESS